MLAFTLETTVVDYESSPIVVPLARSETIEINGRYNSSGNPQHGFEITERASHEYEPR